LGVLCETLHAFDELHYVDVVVVVLVKEFQQLMENNNRVINNNYGLDVGNKDNIFRNIVLH
jgi:hypothetical protein